MKANKRQIALAAEIAKYIKEIPLGNDINSPSHESYNEDMASGIIYDAIGLDFSDMSEDLEAILTDIFDISLQAIRKIK